MRTQIVKVADVRVGDLILKPPSQSFRVAAIATNPVHGWIGFQNGAAFGFFGWFKPEQEVAQILAETPCFYLQWQAELALIEARHFSAEYDVTRAAILRSCMRATEGGC